MDSAARDGQYAEALSLGQQACEEARTALGETHFLYATSLNRLANLYQDWKDFAQAEPLLRRVVALFHATMLESLPYARSLHNLGVLYKAMGDFEQAKTLLSQAVEVFRAAQGDDSLDYAESLHNLAFLYWVLGDHASAEPRLCQAMEIRRAVQCKSSPDYASRNYLRSLYLLAWLYMSNRDHARAEQLLRQDLEVRRASLGEASPSLAGNIATCLGLLAAVYVDAGDSGRVEPLLREAIDLLRSARSQVDPVEALLPGDLTQQYLGALDNLADLYRFTGDNARAEPLCREAVNILRAGPLPVLMDGSGMVGLLLNPRSTSRSPALVICHRALGDDRQDFADSLDNLAVLCVALGRPLEALPLLEQALVDQNGRIAQLVSMGSEQQRLVFLNRFSLTQHRFLSLICQHLTAAPDAVVAALNMVLRRKALVAESVSAQRDAILVGRYPTLQERLRELTALRQQIARQTLAGPGPEGPQAHLQWLHQRQQQKERLEADLARQIPEMYLEPQLQAADRRAVALALPAGSALVEFVRFHVFDFKAVPARGERHWHPPRYLAFVLPAGDPDRVRLIDLGEAEPIDQLVAAFRADVTDEAKLLDLAKASRRPIADTGASPGERLRAAVFDPLADALGGCRRLFLAPDGDLTRLPFEALPLADGRHLLDAYRLSYLNAGRDLLRFQVRSNRQPAGPLVTADPDFDLGRVPVAPTATPPVACRLSRDLDRSQCHFARLPGTRAEGERVARRLGVSPLLGGAALEGRLKTCRSPRILHLATHGFFLPDQPRDLNQLGRNLELIGVGEMPGLGRLSGPGMEDPMLRSGLALAGANTFLRGAAPPPEAEDGLLTAEDVAGLDLLDTELVVLSACETGLGAVHVGEGVFGLRRAFIVAGAKTLVMSLWKVPDLATAFLMDRFYDNLLTRGLDRDLALNEARRATRDVTVGQLRGDWLTPEAIAQFGAGDADARRHLEQLAGQPDDHRPFASPFFWGAFICQGDPSPLPSTKTAGKPEPQAGA
jgi:CHAT domain-containing protein/tetratricopeptide (TPR) repeat protein